MSESLILYEQRDSIAILTLNRPKVYNALNQAIKYQLLEELNKCKNDNSVKVIILTGAGKGFCAGADLTDFASRPAPRDVRDDLNLLYGAIIRRLTDMHKPVICAINGPIAGAGIGVGLACDYKLMADSASLRFAFVNIGLVSDAGSTWLLTREVGYTKALELIYGGEKVLAETCGSLGIVNKVVKAEYLMDEAMSLAKSLAAKPPLAFDATKRAVRHAMTHGLFDSIAFEADRQMELIASEDHSEGVMAFIQKRPPAFKGK